MINPPGDGNRHVIIGMTGSGKTHAGLYWLSTRSFDSKPWVIFDFKRDENIAEIPGIRFLDMSEKVPGHPGIYAYNPIPETDDDETVERHLWSIWRQTNTGIFFDEGAAIPRFSKAARAIMTQGRSLRVPIIALTQRPVNCQPYLLSEAEFHQLFYIHNPRDIKTMREWMPLEFIPENFHSLYYDVKSRRMTHLGPFPKMEEIMQRFQDKQPKPRRPLF